MKIVIGFKKETVRTGQFRPLKTRIKRTKKRWNHLRPMKRYKMEEDLIQLFPIKFSRLHQLQPYQRQLYHLGLRHLQLY